MNNNDKIKKSIIESIVVVSIMALYIVYGIHFLPLLMLFIPLPFIVLGVRNNIYNNIISIITASLIVGIILGTLSGASIILIFAPLSVAINYCIKSRKKSTEILLISSIVFFISFVFLIALGGKVSDLDLAKQAEQGITQILTMQIEILKEMGMTNYEILQTTDWLETAYKTFIVLIPSLLGVFSFVVSYLNILFSSIILRRMGYGFNFERFSRFKLPNNIITGTGIMFLTAFIIKFLEIGYHEALLFNLTFLVSIMFFIQGLAVLDFLFIKIKMRLFSRVIVLIISVIFIPMTSILFFIGILDTIFDMRKIRRQKSL